MAVVLLAALLVAQVVQAAEVPRAALAYRHTVIRESRVVWGLAAPSATFAAQIAQESGWNANATSPVGARGLTQFMPATEGWIKRTYPVDLGEGDALNPAWAIRAMLLYDAYLWQRLAVEPGCEQMAFTLSAYNGGLGWVKRDQAKTTASGGDARRWFGMVEAHNGGRSAAAFTENRSYPRRILLVQTPMYTAAGFGLGAC